MKLNRMIALLVLALLMALCMVLVGCGSDPIEVGANPGAHEHEPTPDNGGEGGEETPTPGSVCLHKTYTIVNKRSADCQTEGYSGDKVCSSCEKVLEAGHTTAKGGCDYEEVAVLLEANCENVGIKTCVCTVCGDERTESIKELGHQLVYEDAYEVENGTVKYSTDDYHTVRCTREGCGYSVTEKHGGRLFNKDATCEDYGYSYATCNACRVEYRLYDYTKAPTEHQWGEWEETTAPTCQTEGEMTRTCSKGCTETKPIEINPDAHTWDEGVVNGDVVDHTCTNTGCEATKQEPVIAPAPEGGSDEE